MLLDDKRFTEVIQGAVFCEWTEAIGLSRAEVAMVQQRMTAVKDTVRRAFHRNPKARAPDCDGDYDHDADCLPNDGTGLNVSKLMCPSTE